MLPEFTYGKLADEVEVKRLGQIIAQCFIAPASETEQYFKLLGVENFRVVRQDKQIVSGLATLPMGQWYGGVSVPMTGIGAVGVAPEARGSGAAIALMQNVVRELHESGIPLSVLYPATQRLYRKAGYEQGGSRCLWEISTQSVQVREQPLPVKPIDCDGRDKRVPPTASHRIRTPVSTAGKGEPGKFRSSCRNLAARNNGYYELLV